MNQPQLIFRNTVALASARLIERGAGAALSLLIARHLGASALGVYSAAIVFLNLISLAAEMGSTTFLTREIARDRTRTGAYVVHFGAITLAVSCCVMPAALFVVPRLSYSADLRASVYVIVFATLPAVLRIIQEAVFLAHQRAEFIIWSTTAGALLNIGASLLLLLQGHGIVSMVVVFTAVQCVMTLFYFVLLNRYICQLRWRFSFRFAWTLIRQVRAFAGSSVLAGLLSRPEVLILSLFRNDAQIGFYSAALRMVDLWGVVPETYMKNVFPVLSHAYVSDRGRCQIIVDKSIQYLLAASLPLMCGMFVAARPLVQFLYGPGFGPSVPVLRVMALCVPLTFLFELFWRLLAARDEQHLMLRAQLIMVFVRLTGGYLLIARMASFGAALSSALAITTHILLLIWYARRDGTRLSIWRLAWRLSLAALSTAAAAAVLINRLELWLVALTAGVIYAVMVLLLKALSPADFALLRKMRDVRTPA